MCLLHDAADLLLAESSRADAAEADLVRMKVTESARHLVDGHGLDPEYGRAADLLLSLADRAQAAEAELARLRAELATERRAVEGLARRICAKGSCHSTCPLENCGADEDMQHGRVHLLGAL